mgnify:CR=1 FL=1
MHDQRHALALRRVSAAHGPDFARDLGRKHALQRLLGERDVSNVRARQLGERSSGCLLERRQRRTPQVELGLRLSDSLNRVPGVWVHRRLQNERFLVDEHRVVALRLARATNDHARAPFQRFVDWLCSGLALSVRIHAGSLPHLLSVSIRGQAALGSGARRHDAICHEQRTAQEHAHAAS